MTQWTRRTVGKERRGAQTRAVRASQGCARLRTKRPSPPSDAGQSYIHHVMEFFSALHSLLDGDSRHLATILHASVVSCLAPTRSTYPSASGSMRALLISNCPVPLIVMFPTYTSWLNVLMGHSERPFT